MKLRMFLPVMVAMQILAAACVSGQVIRPIDPNKKADIDTKSSLNLGQAQFPNVSQPVREQPKARLWKDNVQLESVESKQVDFQTLGMSSVEKPVLPQSNFTAKRAAVTMNDASNKTLNHAKQKAPITNSQIRAFAPGGEQELKKQLNEPH